MLDIIFVPDDGKSWDNPQKNRPTYSKLFLDKVFNCQSVPKKIANNKTVLTIHTGRELPEWSHCHEWGMFRPSLSSRAAPRIFVCLLAHDTLDGPCFTSHMRSVLPIQVTAPVCSKYVFFRKSTGSLVDRIERKLPWCPHSETMRHFKALCVHFSVWGINADANQLKSHRKSVCVYEFK